MALEHLQAALAMKCPQCHQGPLFTHAATNLNKFDQMPEHCPVCGLRYERELGFYWGAMYMSYGLSVGIVVTLGLVLYNFFNDPPTWVYLTAVASTIVIFTPILFRYGRVMMLYWFGSVSFNPKYRT